MQSGPVECFRYPDQLSDSRLRKDLACDFVVSKAVSSLQYVYYDTFDWDLRSQGRLLVRTDGNLALLDCRSNRRLIELSFDSVAEEESGSLCLPKGVLKKELSDLAPHRSFLPLARSVEDVARFAVLNENRKIVVRVDFGEIRKTKGGRCIARVATVRELVGYRKEAARLREWLQGRGFTKGSGHFELCIESCLTEWGEQAVLYSLNPFTAYDRESTVLEALLEILGQTVRAMSCLEAGIRKDVDTEFLHDYRVSVRRLRSMLRLFPKVLSPEIERRLNDDLRRIGKATNLLRDLDVYLLSKEEHRKLVPEMLGSGLARFFDCIEKRRSVAFNDLVVFLDSGEYRRLASRCSKLSQSERTSTIKGVNADELFQEQAAIYVVKQYEKVMREISRLDESTEDEKIHRLRIHCKRLRYSIDFGRCVFDANAADGLVRRFKKLQNALGRFNDESVQMEFLQELIVEDGSSGPRQSECIASVGAMISALDREHFETRSRVLKQLARIDGKKGRSLLNQLIACS